MELQCVQEAHGREGSLGEGTVSLRGDVQAAIAAVQRPETHICIDGGASRSACPFGYAPEVTARGTALPMFSIDGAFIQQRGYKSVQWEKLGQRNEADWGHHG